MGKEIDGVASGTAAEYFVAGELLRGGMNAYLSIGTHKQVDVIVKAKSEVFSTIDVKAVHGPKPNPDRKGQTTWNMPKVEKRGSSPNFFYALVWMGTKRGDYATPEYFVIPAAWAAKYCAEPFAAYIAEKPTRNAESTMRRLSYSDVVEWRDRWDLLEIK